MRSNSRSIMKIRFLSKIITIISIIQKNIILTRMWINIKVLRMTLKIKIINMKKSSWRCIFKIYRNVVVAKWRLNLTIIFINILKNQNVCERISSLFTSQLKLSRKTCWSFLQKTLNYWNFLQKARKCWNFSRTIFSASRSSKKLM